MSDSKRIALALYSIVAAATSGGALATAGTGSSRTILSVGFNPDNVVLLSGVLGVVVSVVLGWVVSRGLGEAWRRGVISVVAAFGAGLLSLAAVMVDMFLPQLVVFGYVIVLLAVAAATARLARKAGGEHVPGV